MDNHLVAALSANLIDVLRRPNNCDGTLRNTKRYLRDTKHNVRRNVRWLQRHGAYCDCEVVLNVDYARRQLCAAE